MNLINKIKLNTHRIKRQLKENPKIFIVLFVVMVLPILMVALLFYVDINWNNLTASFNPSSNSDDLFEKNIILEKEFDLRLISRDKFLEKYKTRPTVLPQAIELNVSLSGFLKSNSAIKLLPARNWAVPFIDIDSTVALAIEFPNKRVLYGKNIFEVRPIASLSKLITALVVVENLKLDDIVIISQNAIETEGNSAGLVAGEKLTVNELLYALLLESSNDAAVALEEYYNTEKESGFINFIELLNQKALELGLSDTLFVDSSGLGSGNVSSAYSIAQILYEAFQDKTLKKIMATSTFSMASQNESFTYYWVNLNTLLGAYEGIIAGKTGYTDEAGPSMAILVKPSYKDTYTVIVVLNAKDRVEATINIYEWIKKAYIWKE